LEVHDKVKDEMYKACSTNGR